MPGENYSPEHRNTDTTAEQLSRDLGAAAINSESETMSSIGESEVIDELARQNVGPRFVRRRAVQYPVGGGGDFVDRVITEMQRRRI